MGFHTREAIENYIAVAKKSPGEFLFDGRRVEITRYRRAIRVRLGAGDRERLEAVVGSGTARRSISGGRGLCCQRHRRSPGGHQSLLAGDQRQPQTFVWTGDPSPSSKRSAAGNKVLESIHSLMSAFSSSRRVNSWLSFKRLFEAVPGAAGGAVVVGDD